MKQYFKMNKDLPKLPPLLRKIGWFHHCISIFFILSFFCSPHYSFAQLPVFSSSTISIVNPQPGQLAVCNDLIQGCGHGVFTHEGYQTLDSISHLIKALPDFVFQLSFHTDCRADSIFNMYYSQRLADSAVFYIKSKIHSNRIVAVGKGENEPINECRCEGSYIQRKCTEEEHQVNRRAVLLILCRD